MALTDQYEVLDEAGLKTGQLLELKEIHRRELWHEVANVWIISTRGELLMQLRAPGVELAPSTWDTTIGTHIHPNETPQDAALRCLDTELGLHFATDDLKHLFNVQSPNPMPNGMVHKVHGHVFLINKDVDINQLHFDPDKITKFAWMPLMKLMADIGNAEARKNYFPRANTYYPQLFQAFQAWM